MTPAPPTRTDATGVWVRPRRTAAGFRRRIGDRGSGWPAQLVRFGAVGGSATVVQLAAYAFLVDSIGAQPANVASWLVSTVVATEAHRRYSFGSSGPGVEADHAVGMLTSAVSLLLSTVALAVLGNPSGTAGVLALVAVNGAVGVMRFVTLRWWMVGRLTRATRS